MSPNPSTCSPKYDAHGGLLIILFMLSSVREQSGWSTMTGRISFERFEVSLRQYSQAYTDLRLYTLL
jgi:hypothetical protein